MTDLIQKIVEDFDFSKIAKGIDQSDLFFERYYDKIFDNFIAQNGQLSENDCKMFLKNLNDFDCKFKYKVVDFIELCDIVKIYKNATTSWIDIYGANLNWLDISNMESLLGLFMRFPYSDKLDVSQWDVHNVKNMIGTFELCEEFNGDLSKWDTSNVEYTNSMFRGCKKFNCDISGWNVHNIKMMKEMFDYCLAFNQDLSDWCLQNVRNMDCAFRNCINLKKTDFDKWQVPNLNSCRDTFTSAYHSPLPMWYTNRVK